MKKLLTLIAVFASFTMWAQTQVSGTVTDAEGQPLPGANIVLDGTTGAVSDFDGNFSLSTDQQPPFTLTVSSVGFESTTVDVTSPSESLTIQLSEGVHNLMRLWYRPLEWQSEFLSHQLLLKSLVCRKLKTRHLLIISMVLQTLKG